MTLKLQQLKEEAYSSWETLNMLDGATLTPGQFKADIRRYGNGRDLRRKEVWLRACIQLEALWLLKGIENRDMVRHLLDPDTEISKAYNAEVLEAILQYPSGIEQIRNGLERLYYQPVRSSDMSVAVEFLNRIAQVQSVEIALPPLAIAG
jgi:hypothetical protein